MYRKDWITQADLIDITHEPVKLIFNAVSEVDLIETLRGVSAGIGFGVNYGACVFPNELDEYDIKQNGLFAGIEFGLHNGDEIIINADIMRYYLDKICEAYLRLHNEHELEIQNIIFEFEKNFQNYGQNRN